MTATLTVDRLNPYLRHILLFDAATCALFAAACLGFTGPVAALTAIPTGWIAGAGAICLAFAVLLAVIARREPIPRAGLNLAIAINFAWVAASFASLIFGWIAPNTFGMVLVAGQAVAVLAVTDLQILARGGAAA
jgi:hypothetical protein